MAGDAPELREAIEEGGLKAAAHAAHTTEGAVAVTAAARLSRVSL